MTARDPLQWEPDAPREPPPAPLDGYPVQELFALDRDSTPVGEVAQATIGIWIRLLETELREFPQRDTPALENIKAQLLATHDALQRVLPASRWTPRSPTR